MQAKSTNRAIHNVNKLQSKSQSTLFDQRLQTAIFQAIKTQIRHSSDQLLMWFDYSDQREIKLLVNSCLKRLALQIKDDANLTSDDQQLIKDVVLDETINYYGVPYPGDDVKIEFVPDRELPF